MLENASRALAATTPPPIRAESYTVELGQLAGGDIRIALMATTIDEQEGDLLFSEIATERVRNIDDALALVKANIWFS